MRGSSVVYTGLSATGLEALNKESLFFLLKTDAIITHAVMKTTNAIRKENKLWK